MSRALVLADVDGTLVTPEKVLTPRAQRAVNALHQSGVAFSIVSGRPPRGMKHLVETLGLDVPLAAFNGAAIVQPDLSPVRVRCLDPDVVHQAIHTLTEHQLDCWLYSLNEWFIRDPNAPHVEKETRTVQFEPRVVREFKGEMKAILKVVGVSDDHERVSRCEAALQGRLKESASASRSQPYYVDVTHPDANKGTVITDLCELLDIPRERAITLGDMPNDILMFKASGFSIAMGNAPDEVKRAADFTTNSNSHEGFAEAVDHLLSVIRSPAA